MRGAKIHKMSPKRRKFPVINFQKFHKLFFLTTSLNHQKIVLLSTSPHPAIAATTYGGGLYYAIYDVIRHPGGTDHSIDQVTIDRNDEAKDYMRLNAIRRRQALNQSL
jgi:hypothetical protein